jgi:hypothetical protein
MAPEPAALRGDPKRTPFQLKVNDLVGTVVKVVGPTVKLSLCAFLVRFIQLGIDRSER